MATDRGNHPWLSTDGQSAPLRSSLAERAAAEERGAAARGHVSRPEAEPAAMEAAAPAPDQRPASPPAVDGSLEPPAVAAAAAEPQGDEWRIHADLAPGAVVDVGGEGEPPGASRGATPEPHSDEAFYRQSRHVFVLSSAGKPIYEKLVQLVLDTPGTIANLMSILSKSFAITSEVIPTPLSLTLISTKSPSSLPGYLLSID